MSQGEDNYKTVPTLLSLTMLIPPSLHLMIEVNLLDAIKSEELIQGLGNQEPLCDTEIDKRMETGMCDELVRAARVCIENNRNVQLCPTGIGGAYFIYDEYSVPIAVFKPQDEEPGGVNNPKNLSEGLLPPGEGYLREIAAWFLDHGRHAGVPETHFLRDVTHDHFSNNSTILKSKLGSVQRYIPNIGDAESISSSRLLVEDVHNIGILDIRIFNMDRNLENLLVRVEDATTYRLVPIDHAYSLPPNLEAASFDWLHWKQAKEPFSEENLRYIEGINVERDANILRSLGISEKCIKTMKISSLWLKWGAAAGLTLHQIASVVCRPKPSEKSHLEVMVSEIEKLSGGMESQYFFLVLHSVMRRYLETLFMNGTNGAPSPKENAELLKMENSHRSMVV